MDNKIIERIELNTDTGKYIKCNHCNRLSPEQKYCKYCFNLLELNGGGEKSDVRQIYITRPKSYSPVSDFSIAREKIDSEFEANKIDFASLGLTEEEYNLKFTPPEVKPLRDEYKPEITDKFNEAYKKFERKVMEAAASENEKKEEKAGVRQIISETPSQVVFTAAAPKEEIKSDRPVVPEVISRNKNLYTVKRNSNRFKASFLSFFGLFASIAVICSLFLPVYGSVKGMDLIAVIPKALGLNLASENIPAAAGQVSLVIASASYMLIGALNLYAFLSFAFSVMLDRKQKTYAEFVLSFTALLSSVVLLFMLLLAEVTVKDFAAGSIVLFVAQAINFICATGRLVKE